MCITFLRDFDLPAQQQINHHWFSQSYDTLVTHVIQQVNSDISYPSLWLAHNGLRECLVVFAPARNKIIADLPPQVVSINDWLICFLLTFLGGMVLFLTEAQVFLKATCSLKWCDSRVKVRLEEKWDAGICQVYVRRPK